MEAGGGSSMAVLARVPQKSILYATRVARVAVLIEELQPGGTC